MSCEVPPACSAHHRRSTIDGLHDVDGTRGPVAFGDPHVPPCMWRDHGDTSGHHHDPRSSHREHSGLWADVSMGNGGMWSGLLSAFDPRRAQRLEGQEVIGHPLRLAHS
jgi:hypothetical protein